jgi:hypothetical protein
MDDIVRQAMAKWPHVPDCYGWLGLDARGAWFLRDAPTQAAGPFRLGGTAKGDAVQHEKLLAFIGRNYHVDDRGCWYFQNGPQRVFVELELAPWIWRLTPELVITAHTGRSATLDHAVMDEHGRVYLMTDLGLGLVHSMDVPLVAAAVDNATWHLRELPAAELPARYGFVNSPQLLQTAN